MSLLSPFLFFVEYLFIVFLLVFLLLAGVHGFVFVSVSSGVSAFIIFSSSCLLYCLYWLCVVTCCVLVFVYYYYLFIINIIMIYTYYIYSVWLLFYIIYIYICIYMYIYTYIYAYINIHINICIYKSTYIYI